MVPTKNNLDGEALLGSYRFVLLAELMLTTEFSADSKDVSSMSAISVTNSMIPVSLR